MHGWKAHARPTNAPRRTRARAACALAACLAAGSAAACAPESDEVVGPDEAWVLTFSDEFDGPVDQSPNPSIWSYDLGGSGWGNQELQHYTDRPANASLDGAGNLRIQALREAFGERDYTSARLKTQGAFAQQYGRFEARIRLPRGRGIWPAFWSLGDDFEEVGWPRTGEIDFMEYRGQETRIVHGTIHGPGYAGGEAITRSFRLEEGSFDEDFHVFAVEWDPGRIAWSVDGVVYHIATTAGVRPRGDWVFDHPFFLILNVAVGGTFVGNPDGTTEFPATMLVDYVRVYERGQ